MSATVSLAIAVTILLSSSRIGEQEQPPCHACIQSGDNVPQVTVCELSKHPEHFSGKLVRIEADFQHDSGQFFLREKGCGLQAGFAKEKQSCDGAWRRLQITCGVDGWYDSSAPVTVLGSISKIPDWNYDAGQDGFTITCLERVRTEPNVGQRLRFAIARLSRGLV